MVARDPVPLRRAYRRHQEVHFDGAHGLNFRIDLVLKDAVTRRPLAVLDTKYKNTSSPSSSDIQQVVAYAEAKGCKTAFLIYPKPVPSNACFKVRSVTVRSVCFEITDELQDGGRKLLDRIMDALTPANAAMPDDTSGA
jgi:5-methylcytosine-specific restriction enzyme subunit McrC